MIETLVRLAIIGLGVIGFIFVARVIFTIIMAIKINRLLSDLPWLQWLTLNDVVAMGYSRWWSRILLTLIYRAGYFEVRLLSDIPEPKRSRLADVEFDPSTVEYYEFKLTKRGGKKKIKLWSWTTSFLQPA